MERLNTSGSYKKAKSKTLEGNRMRNERGMKVEDKKIEIKRRMGEGTTRLRAKVSNCS